MAASSGTNIMARGHKKSVLNRKYPSNPRYRHVKPVVDSGDNIRSYAESIEERFRHFKFGKDEIFRRIGLESFLQLIVEIGFSALQEPAEQDMAKGCHSHQPIVPSNIQDGPSPVDRVICPSGDIQAQSPRQEVEEDEGLLTSRSTLHCVINGIGEMDLKAKNNDLRHGQPDTHTDARRDIQKPYLLLDVRDCDAYCQSHLLSAVNYPHPMTSRSVNYETKDLLTYKNNAGTIIVIYDEDETYSQKVATTLVQRGYDNIYLLSGGLKLIRQKFGTELEVTFAQLRLREDAFTIDDLRRLQELIDKQHLMSSSTTRNRRSSSNGLENRDSSRNKFGRRRPESTDSVRQAEPEKRARASSVTTLDGTVKKPWK